MTSKKRKNIDGVMTATSIFYKVTYDDPRFAELVLAVADKEDGFTKKDVKAVLCEKMAA